MSGAFSKNPLRAKLRNIRIVSFFWALAAVLLPEAPAALLIGCEARLQSMAEINRIGILAIVWFVLAAIICFGLGLWVFLSGRNLPLVLHPDWEARFRQKQQQRLSALILTLLLAVCPLLGSAEPIVNLFTRRDLDRQLIADYYTWLFLAGGFSLGIAVFGVLRYYLTGLIRPVYDDTLPRPAAARPRRWLIPAAAVTVAVGIAVVVLMRQGTWLLQPYISAIPAVPHSSHEITYDNSTGVYTIDAGDEDFRILQLTDIHLGGSIISSGKDYAALEAVYALIESEQPDLIVITGDLVFPLGIMSFSLNNYVPMVQLASFLRNIGIPWAVTFGNHDTEDIATHAEDEIAQVLEQFGFARTGSLLYPETQPDIHGRSNQMLLLRNGDGSIRQALFLLDSGDYQSDAINDYDYIHDDQVAWYRQSLEQLEAQTGSMPKSLLFFHIPLQEYQTAYDLYKAGSPLVTRHYGKIGESGEAICASATPSTLFEEAAALGSTQGMFVGHDHYNNLSLTYRGIRLTYGMSIDYLAMPGIASKTEQRGGTRITLHPDGSFDCCPLPLTDITG